MKNRENQSKHGRMGFVLVMGMFLGLGSGLKVEGAAGVLSRIPDSAPAFVVVKNPRGLSDTVAGLNRDLGLNHPMLSDLMMMLKFQMGIGGGVDEGGDFAAVMTRMVLPPEQPEILLLVPVLDYGAFAKDFGILNSEGVAAIQLGGKASFMKQSGGYAVLGEKQATVEAFEEKVYGKWDGYGGQFGERVLGGSNVVMGLDVGQLGPVMQPMVAMQIMKMKQDIDKGGESMPAAQRESLETAKLVFDGYGKAIDAALRDGQAVLVGLSVDADGIGFNGSMQFKEGSELAGAMKGAGDGGRVEVLGAPGGGGGGVGGGGGGVGFDRLPNRPFMMAVSYDLSVLPYSTWLDEVGLLAEAGGSNAEMIEEALKLYKAVPTQQQGVYPPTPGGAAPSLFSIVSVVKSEAPARVLEKFKGWVEWVNGKDLGGGMKYNSSYTEGAKQVGGMDVDSIKMQMEMTPEMMAQMGMMSMFTQSMTNFSAVTKEDAVVIASASDDALLEAALGVEAGDSLEANAALGSVREQLYPDRVLEGYVGVGTIAEAGLQMMAFFMPGMEVEVPKELPPIGFGISVKDGGVGDRLYFPMPLVKAMVKMGLDAQRMFQAPPGGGPGDPGDPGAGQQL